MTEYLDGVAAAFYRGIGPETQFIGPLSRINFFIGENNSGKSIVLNLIVNHLPRKRGGKSPKTLEPVEVYKGSATGSLVVAVGAKPERVMQRLDEHFNTSPRDNILAIWRRARPTAEKIINNLLIHEMIWVAPLEKDVTRIFGEPDVRVLAEWDINWSSIWNALTNRTGGDQKNSWIPGSIGFISGFVYPDLPEILLIPAKRQLGAKGETFTDLSGRGLIDHLATLQNPSYDRQADRTKFGRINGFLQEVTGNSEATLEVPSEREHLLVHMNNKVLPLSSLGTGIHEVILIAAFCTIHDGKILCIEEPEIHLHPLLQRKLIKYLSEKTTSQYFIATHSSSFIDMAQSSVFHVRNDGVQTYVKLAISSDDKRRILDELGYYASDILQANSVVWVEGPSDRIYLRHWIEAIDGRLVEGIHYTIMFYGGGLIRHLSASDEAVEEFIKLRLLNRNMAIVIDSDRESETDTLKPHAARIAKEMSEGDGIAWVTAGREVENYVDFNRLQDALKIIHPRLYIKPAKEGRFEHAFYFYRIDPNNPDRSKIYPDADKVGAANIICAEPANLEILDLRERVTELVQMIKRANGVE